MAKLMTGVLISGRGSNMKALIEACAEPGFPAAIVLVISNKADAAGLKIAEDAGVKTLVISHRDFESREAFDAALDESLCANNVKFLCLAGFMRLLSEGFVRKWHDRIINIHPSLLPSFKGMNTHERVLQSGVRFSGCTVHFIRPDMDEGPPIIQAAVPVHEGDTSDDLAARVLAAEHKAYPLALRLIAENRVHVANEVVRIEGAAAPAESLINPRQDS